MEDEDTMPKQNDRKRVKDRIIEGIAKAVKHIQSYQLNQPSEDQVTVLKNSDWQFHKLVENLDHAFLYGLRHFTNGYWVIVQEFTHKSTIDDVVKMSNIITNIGRSRAWLYLALSDHLLESYILCFMKNTDLVRKHYVKEALVLDEQRLQLLLTLSSGLDLVAFELEVDVQYLDLSSHLKTRTDGQEEEEDDLSLCSMRSSQSQGSSMEESHHSRLTISPLSLISDLFRPLTSKPTASSSFISEETEAEKKLRIETFANTNVIVPEIVRSPEVSEDTQEEVAVDTEVEVIHVKRKHRHSKRKDSRTQRTSSTPTSDNVSLISVESTASLLSPISSESSGYRSVSEDKQCADDGINSSSSTGKSSDETVIVSDERPEKQTEKFEEKLSPDERLRRILEDNQVEKQEVRFNRTIEWKTGADPSPPKTTDSLFSDRATVASDTSPERTTDVARLSLTTSPQNSNSREQLNGVNLNVDEQQPTTGDDASALVASIEEPSIYDDVPISLKELPDAVEQTSEASYDIATLSSSTSTSPVSLEVDARDVETQHSTESSSAVCTEAKANHEDGGVAETKSPKVTSVFQADKRHAADIEVDNNLKLVLMLEIFLHEDEDLYKMFQTCQGHTEGEISVTYVVITSHSLYLLKPSCKPNKFIREVAISFKELDYVSISLNHQILHIVCHVRQNQFWLTTGDEVLTRLIVSHLEQAVLLASGQRDTSALSPLTVLTDAMAQKISIAKWVSEETGQQRQDVALLNYTLVHWEDAEAIADGELRLSQHSLEGYLYYKTSTKKVYSYMLFPGSSWNRGYFVLEQGILHQYTDKSCSGTPLKSISLIPEQCHGCRRCPNADRKHCFEVLLADGSSLELAASSDASLQNWLIGLCQATSDQTGTGNPLFGCVTCCTVLTDSHVFMCHEDLQTNFLRTLGSRPLSSLSQIQTDADAMKYCVLVFRTQVKVQNQHDKWCLYFNSNVEQQRFLAAVSDACKKSKTKQSVPQVLPVNDKMSKRCRNGLAKLNQLRRLGGGGGGGAAVGTV